MLDFESISTSEKKGRPFERCDGTEEYGEDPEKNASPENKVPERGYSVDSLKNPGINPYDEETNGEYRKHLLRASELLNIVLERNLLSESKIIDWADKYKKTVDAGRVISLNSELAKSLPAKYIEPQKIDLSEGETEG